MPINFFAPVAADASVRFGLTVALCLLPSSRLASVQDVPPHEAPRSDTLFGRVVLVVDDCDGDGVVDYVVGLPFAGPRELVNSRLPFTRKVERGELYIYSGATAERIFVLKGASGARRLSKSGMRVSGDFDSDGVAEIAASCEATCGVHFISLAKRKELFAIDARMADTIPSIDRNADGVPDVLVSQSSPTPCNAFSGIDGSRLPESVALDTASWTPVRMTRTHLPPTTLALRRDRQRGVAIVDCVRSMDSAVPWIAGSNAADSRIAFASDLDVDGRPELISLDVGSPGESSGFSIAGRMRVWDGRVGTERFAYPFEARSVRPGDEESCIALPGDVDRDGIGDVVIGVPYLLHGGVVCLSGRSGDVLWRGATVTGGADAWATESGVSVCPFFDVDADGALDLLVGCGTFDADNPEESDSNGAVLVISGRTGRVLRMQTEVEEVRTQ